MCSSEHFPMLPSLQTRTELSTEAFSQLDQGRTQFSQKRIRAISSVPVVGKMKLVAVVVRKICFTSSMTDFESLGNAGER